MAQTNCRCGRNATEVFDGKNLCITCYDVARTAYQEACEARERTLKAEDYPTRAAYIAAVRGL